MQALVLLQREVVRRLNARLPAFTCNLLYCYYTRRVAVYSCTSSVTLLCNSSEPSPTAHAQVRCHRLGHASSPIIACLRGVEARPALQQEKDFLSILPAPCQLQEICLRRRLCFFEWTLTYQHNAPGA